MFRPHTWAVWIVLTSFVLFIALGDSQKSAINTYFGFFLMYVCKASEHVGSKRELVYFKLDLAQQLIDGFSQ